MYVSILIGTNVPINRGIMGKGRPFSTSTQFKMIIHTNGNHRYASTKPYTIGKDGIKRYTYKHWGALDEQNRSIPGMAYMYASIEERQQLIFPKDWDLSQIEILSGTKRRGRIAYEAEDVDRQFGPTWLLNQVAVKIGLLDDLRSVFSGNMEMVNDILPLLTFHLSTTSPTISYHNGSVRSRLHPGGT